MRRGVRILGTTMIVSGVVLLGWALATWRWEDPLTSLYTAYEQRKLDQGLDERFAAYRGRGPTPTAGDAASLAVEARRYRRGLSAGDGIGRIVVPRLDLRMAFVFGVDTQSLKRGPGMHPRTFLPGQDELVYIAGHRTTYGAPFSRIDSLRKGDRITLEMPYGTFVYSVTGSRVVKSDNTSVLRSRGYEQVALQACHPRFFASHRWITYGRLVDKTGVPTGSEAAAGSGQR
jgi:sortase A